MKRSVNFSGTRKYRLAAMYEAISAATECVLHEGTKATHRINIKGRWYRVCDSCVERAKREGDYTIEKLHDAPHAQASGAKEE